MIKKLILTALSILILFSVEGYSQISRQRHTSLRAALDRNDYAAAEKMLVDMRRSGPDGFARNNYDYLLGRLFDRRGAYTEAAGLFQKVAGRKSALAGYALWHLAETARATDNSAEEQRLLLEFLGQYGSHIFRERTIQRLADSYFNSRKYQAVIDCLRNYSTPRRDALAMIGEAQMMLRRLDSARISFTAVLANGSTDDASLRAAAGLDRLDDADLTAVTEADRLRRARIYQINRHFADARKHWLAFIRDFPQSDKRAEALFALGRGYFLEDQYNEAAKWYTRAYNEFPRTPEGEQGFYYVGHCHQYLKEADLALTRYEAFLRTYPKSDYTGYAHLNAIDTLRSVGRLDEALKWAARAQALTGEPFANVTGLFYQARIHLQQDNYQAALADFTELKARNLNVRGLSATTNPAEVIFMRGYCMEKLGRFEEAVNEYLSLNEVRNGAAGYYARRGSEHLRSLQNNQRSRNLIIRLREQFLQNARNTSLQGNPAAAKTAANQALRFALDESSRGEMLRVLKSSYARLKGYQSGTSGSSTAGRTEVLSDSAAAGTDHQTIADELLFLGLYDEGALELAETAASKSTILYYCSKGECANRTIDYYEPVLNSLPDDFRVELLPRELAEVFYPFPFRELLALDAASRNVDPRFVLSIIRQESRYNPSVKSAAAARGMMQFISQTANQIADQLKLQGFGQNDLYNPEIAILMGSQYLQNLFVEFGSPEAAAAAYNGSEDSVRRWISRAQDNDVERMIIEIAKRETKDYVFKVMNFYDSYLKLYPNEFQKNSK
ncbi:MAG: transglycosylase SLT domain-containing protein [Acidobacteria bacterium]|nr:transglycosylase SLT domain-containing protein [Acidobacteriota bacterium]